MHELTCVEVQVCLVKILYVYCAVPKSETYDNTSEALSRVLTQRIERLRQPDTVALPPADSVASDSDELCDPPSDIYPNGHHKTSPRWQRLSEAFSPCAATLHCQPSLTAFR